ncbi:MAG: DUF2202 domain-containing protein [Halothiobacillaceae bacterium]
MRKRPIESTLIAPIIAGLGLSLLTACGGGASTTGMPSTPTLTTACPPVVAPLTQAEIDEALFMREEEKLARDVYEYLAAFWLARAGQVPVVTIMSNIRASEQQHMDSMKAVLDCYGLPDPVDAAETRGVFVNPELANLYTTLTAQGQASELAALEVGALIEEVDIQDLADSIAISQQTYTDTVYANLMCGSRNHLRSFAKQIINQAGSYTAQVLDQATVDAILASPMEQCGTATSNGRTGQGYRGGR